MPAGISACGTSRTSRDVRFESAKWAKADMFTDGDFMSTRPNQDFHGGCYRSIIGSWSHRRCRPSRPHLCWWWPSRLVATATSANCLTLNYYRLAIGTSRQVLMVGEWGTLLPVLRCPARLFATAIEGLILPEPSESTRRQRARVRG